MKSYIDYREYIDLQPTSAPHSDLHSGSQLES